MVVFPKTGEKLMIYNDDFGLFREGTIHTINGSEIEITFQDGIQKFFIDINSRHFTVLLIFFFL